MSQERPRKPPAVEQQEPTKYGDIFPVSGELSSKPVAPGDAAMMQSAETSVLGKTQKGAVMQSAATRNERAGVVGHRDVTKVVENEGVTLVKTNLPGTRVITESVARQVIGQHVVQPHPYVVKNQARRITTERLKNVLYMYL